MAEEYLGPKSVYLEEWGEPTRLHMKVFSKDKRTPRLH
jgi:hypothetical protein